MIWFPLADQDYLCWRFADLLCIKEKIYYKKLFKTIENLKLQQKN